MGLPVAYPPMVRWIEGTVGGLTTMTRPADTAAYAAGDEVSNDVDQADALWWVFPNVARKLGGRSTLKTINLVTSHNVTFAPMFWLFNAPPTMVGDNVAFSHVLADDDKFVVARVIPFVSVTAIGSKSVSQLLGITGDPILCAPTDTNLYGVLVSAAAYTPISAQTFKLKILVEN